MLLSNIAETPCPSMFDILQNLIHLYDDQIIVDTRFCLFCIVVTFVDVTDFEEWKSK